jgi:hypothetical protein
MRERERERERERAKTEPTMAISGIFLKNFTLPALIIGLVYHTPQNPVKKNGARHQKKPPGLTPDGPYYLFITSYLLFINFLPLIY